MLMYNIHRLVYLAVAAAWLPALLGAQQALHHWRFETPDPVVIDSVGSAYGNAVGSYSYQADTAGAVVRPVTGPSVPNQMSLGLTAGTNGVTFASAFPLHTPGSFTLEFWLKSPCSAHQSVFWTRPDDQDFNRFNFYVNSTATFGFDYRSQTGAITEIIGSGGAGTGVAIPRNVWVHLAITRVGSSYSIYLNGVMKGSGTGTLPLPNAVGWQLSGRTGYALGGQIDEVRISAGALRPAQFLTSFRDLGYGLAGTGNLTPGLGGIGTAHGGTDLSWLLASAQPSASLLLVLSPGTIYAPLLGGTLVPDPAAAWVVPATTDANGEWRLSVPVPPGLAPGQPVYSQAAVLDTGAVRGVALTNAVWVTSP